MDPKNCFSLAIFVTLNLLLSALVSAHMTNLNCPSGPTPSGVSGGPTPSGMPGGPTPSSVPSSPTPSGVPGGPTPSNVPDSPTPSGVPDGPTPSGVPGGPTPSGVPGGPTPSGVPKCPSPPSGPTPSSGPSPSPPCPSNATACNAVLNALQNNGPALPSPRPCCSSFSDQTDVQAALCICGLLRIGSLGRNLNISIPVAFKYLFAFCGRQVPSGFQCT